MSPIADIVVLLAVIIPIAWFVSEFKSSRRVRLTLGTFAILLSFGIAFVVGSLDRFNSNAWFGRATKDLIDATISELDAGHQEAVVRSLKDLQIKYQPTYENRARYDELVRQTVEQMQKGSATPPSH
jgi:hypothetical protein